MLIQLDESIHEDIEELTQQEWDGIINLAVAAREGHHYLIAPRALTEVLSRRTAVLGPRERALYKTLNERYSTLAGMAQKVHTKVRVTRDLVAERVEQGPNVEIRMPLKSFSSISAILPVVLLCENLEDCELIYEFARTFAHVERLGGVKTNLENRSGGGSGTASIAENIMRDGKRLMFAIVDSDKNSPDSALGSTALTIRRVFDRGQPATAELLIIKGRELENLLPDIFYQNEFGQHIDHSDSVAFLTALSEADFGAARLYIDIKKGLNLRSLFEQENPPQDFRNVWGKVVASVSEGGLPCNEACVSCAGAGTCRVPDACACKLTRSNSASLLFRGTTEFRRNGRDWWQTLPSCLQEPLNEVARKIFDWGCAGAFQPS